MNILYLTFVQYLKNISYFYIEMFLNFQLRIQKISPTMSLWDRFFSFVNGMVVGWAQVFVMQPFEIIKVRLQTQPQNNKIYTGIMDCLTKIIKNQGPLALYKGTATPLMGVGLISSARFGMQQNTRNWMAQWKGVKIDELRLFPDKQLCYFVSGIASSFILCPIDHTRIRIQIQKSGAQKIYTGSIDAATKITKAYGLKGLFRGQTASTMRQSTSILFFFTTIDLVTPILAPGKAKKDISPFTNFLIGSAAGIGYWVFNYPIDFVKTLMQSDSLQNPKYKTTAQCFQDEYNRGGWKTFYRGFTICMMRSIPVNATGVMVYRLMQMLSNVDVN